MWNDKNNFFLNKSASFLLKINMLSLLLEEIKNLNSKNRSDELYIFINNSPISNELNLLNQDRFSQNIVAIVIGGEYEFKKLTLNENFLTINIANENGEFIKNIIPYGNIVGFSKYKTFIKSENLLHIDLIKLSQIYEYKKIINDNIDNNNKNFQLNYLINNIIKNNMRSLVENPLEEDELIKITFFEKNIENLEETITGNSYKTKLLVVVIEDDSWNINVEEESIILFLKNEENSHVVKELTVPINNIVTYLDTKNSILFNRYVKIIGEDFDDIDFTIYEKENLVFIDFNSLLEDEVTNNFSNIFNIPNLFLKTNSNKKNTKEDDNLIIGNFDKNNSYVTGGLAYSNYPGRQSEEDNQLDVDVNSPLSDEEEDD